MIPYPPDDAALDLTQREHFEHERHAVVQPSLTDDELVLQPRMVELNPCPRCCSSELRSQPWSEAEMTPWRCQPPVC